MARALFRALARTKRNGFRNYGSKDPEASCDALVVGAGPSGLAFSTRLRQLDPTRSVYVLEKASECGAHTLSGCVLDTRPLDVLFPAWKEEDSFPSYVKVGDNDLFHATSGSLLRLPSPPSLHKQDTIVISLSQLVRWMAHKAEDAGVEILPSCAANKMWLSHEKVAGVVVTGGSRIRARMTAVAEGCRGNVAETILEKFSLRQGRDPPTYGLGMKEVWDIDPSKHVPGRVWHVTGWPLEDLAYGGGFVYHEKKDGRVSLGLVVGLDYKNPYLNPYQEFQKFKSHPQIRKLLEGGTCLQFGAKALNEGGYQSVPQLHFPGGMLLGCAGGLLDVAKIRGVHTALMSGILAAEEAHKALQSEDEIVDTSGYTENIEKSWIWDELYEGRNVRPGFKHGRLFGLANAALESFFLKGRAPWTLHNKVADHETTEFASNALPIEYPRPDGKVSFDVPTSLFRSGTNHVHGQASHLLLHDENVPNEINLKQYAGLEARYCPANVYEYLDEDEGGKRLQINSQNCLHCKSCDIKDPTRNIHWTPPESGGGPAYTLM